MLRFQESMVLGMRNDAGFPSLSSLLCSSSGNPGPSLQSSINAPAELERQSSVNSFSAPDDDGYTACFGLGSSSPFHGLNRGFNTGDGDLMMAAGSVARSAAGVQHKAVAEPRNRRRATVSVNKNQITTPLMSKRQRTTCSMKQHHLPQDESSAVARKTPARRNQKLGDKITALQQLVSPFGKTDTASVLHEAALSIKFLHEQIQMLTDPFSNTRTSKEHDQGLAENNADLQSRGLCLVPVYAIIELIEQEGHEMMLRETALNFH